MNKNTTQRLLIFFLGIPLFIATVLFAGFGRNLILVLFIIGMQILAVRETGGLFEVKGIIVNRITLSIASIILSLLTYTAPLLRSRLGIQLTSLEILSLSSFIGALIILARYIFSKPEKFNSILAEMAASLFTFFYCGVLGAFLAFIATCFENRAEAVFTFTLMTFGNDSLAWLVGVTLGKRRGIIAVSPGKSIAGFFGGMAGSLIAAFLAFIIFSNRVFPSFSSLLILGIAMGLSTISGDLVESALKRSVGVKDSSALVPGRGGILDSFDSLLFSAPLFVAFSIIAGFFNGLA